MLIPAATEPDPLRWPSSIASVEWTPLRKHVSVPTKINILRPLQPIIASASVLLSRLDEAELGLDNDPSHPSYSPTNTENSWDQLPSWGSSHQDKPC